MSVGYHYTSIENYRKIQANGLLPYHIDKPDLKAFFPNGIDGIWIWTEELVSETELGSILWQVMTKASTTIVKLKVEYDDAALLRRYGSLVEIAHDGRLGSWNYHQSEIAMIVTTPILPKNIEVIKYFDLLHLIKCQT